MGLGENLNEVAVGAVKWAPDGGISGDVFDYGGYAPGWG